MTSTRNLFDSRGIIKTAEVGEAIPLKTISEKETKLINLCLNCEASICKGICDKWREVNNEK